MNRIEKNRNIKIDILKFIAIFAVLFYHIGLMKYGYLGVDIFLVINGFLIGKKIYNENENDYKYIGFLIKKLKQFAPLLLLAGVVSLVIGYFFMLPDDYENLAESIVATNFFSNNILAGITTKNYWDILNDFKPLMHTWYMGVLFQSYIIIGLVPLISTKISNKKNKTIQFIIFLVLFFVSLLIYLLPIFDKNIKFYFLPFRIFEILLGVVLAYKIDYIIDRIKKNKIIQVLEPFFLILLLLALFLPSNISDVIRLLFTCAITTLLIIMSIHKDLKRDCINSIISYFGMISYSLFIWHQVILAFIRYTYSVSFSFIEYLVIIGFILLSSIISYEFIEKKIKKIPNKMLSILLIGLCILSTSFSLLIYINSGVVRDVPELEISKSNIHRHMHSEYNDRAYKYDKDFDDNGKIKVLVLGNSYGRDWVNILLESDYKDKINISYIYQKDINDDNYSVEKLNSADYIFYAISSNDFINLPGYLIESFEKNKVYIVGNKRFGDSNGIIYSKRFTKHYYDQTVLLDNIYYEKNEELKNKYGVYYIDMISCVSDDNRRIRVFTNDNKFISQDTRHLTKAGATYYSSCIDFNQIFKKNKEG